ncbi:MAG: hypothetical protein K2M46_07280 [Lachnospiraceae bacterium]|nr:hypothetical protein [Lachnospiraceae bacterium]
MILKKNKKVSRTIMACMMCAAVTLPSLSVCAKPLSRSYSGSFSKAWERYASEDSGKAGLTYGFNTFAFNEDYAWAKHNTQSHYAALKNGSGWHTGSGKKAGSTSKIEVIHKGTSISYYCYY